ncbi:hypothetical protein [Cellulophaga lytica]|uniref:hypothetical protein n=1 Tax=Cellulophaga lytica TaxID=979 RepID=UPI0004F6A504|nr:hypothetical protein [Cellulophaga lytica]AIM60735.1 hypothetical protein IX49_09455 [Cellulophaga lytica]APU10610.1 hypothetical protein A5M85_10050 [Cellulophaga lytica]MDO6852536.1 hypothetical protein [Cellulophaga lytica]
MKKITLLIVFAVMAVNLSAQEGLKIGIQGGIPLDDYTDNVSLMVAADIGHMWALGEVVDLGVTGGYIHGFAEKYHTGTITNDLPDIQFLKAAASVRVWTSNSFSFGADLGQGFGLNDDNEGGFYYRPQIGYLMGESTELNLSYTGIQLGDNTEWSTVSIGIMHTIKTIKRF